MVRRTMPASEAADVPTQWADRIAEHIATDRNSARVNHEVRMALDAVSEIAAQLPPVEPLASDFRRSTSRLLAVVRPLLSEGDRKRCDSLIGYLERKGEQA